MNVRPATPDDYPEITAMLRDFYEAAWTPYTAFDAESTRQTIDAVASAAFGTVFVAAEGTHLSGVIGGLVVPVFFDRAQLMAQEAFWWVRPECRKSGIGLQLMAALEAWARARGAKTITMISVHGSDEARVNRLYTSCGYQPLEYHYAKIL